MKTVGINVDELQYLRGVDIDTHKEINAKWQEFHESKDGNPTPIDVIVFARTIDYKFQDKLIFPHQRGHEE